MRVSAGSEKKVSRAERESIVSPSEARTKHERSENQGRAERGNSPRAK